jgi:DnaJ-class molecular chaperone
MKRVFSCDKCKGRGTVQSTTCPKCGGTGKLVQNVEEGSPTRTTKILNEG